MVHLEIFSFEMAEIIRKWKLRKEILKEIKKPESLDLKLQKR